MTNSFGLFGNSVNSNFFSLLDQNPTQFFSRLIELKNTLNQIKTGFATSSLSSDLSSSFSSSFDTPLGMEFRLAGRVNSQAGSNATEALGALANVSTSLKRQTEILGQLKDLATSAADSSTTFDDRVALNSQATSLVAEYNSLNTTTSYNKLKLMDGSLPSFNIQLGYGAHNQFTVDLNRYTTSQVTGDYVSGSLTSSAIGFASNPKAMANADVNGDRLDDVLIQNSPGLNDHVYVAITTPAGVNGSGSETKVSFTDLVNDSTLADVNGDGNTDILAATEAGIEVAYGLGNGTFNASTILAAGKFTEVHVSDINGDGTNDLTGITNVGDVSSLIATGGGSFSTNTMSTGNLAITSSTTSDLNKDGYGDLTFIDSSGALYSLLGAADGSLSDQKLMGNAGGGSGTYELSAAEFNGDGQTDFVISGPSTSTVFFGQNDRTITAGDTYALSPAASNITVADLNGDGRKDILAKTGASEASIFYSDGSGQFNQTAYNLQGTTVSIADLNGDGLSDLIGSSSAGYRSYLAQPKTTTSIAYFDLTSKLGGTQALTNLSTLQTNLSLETDAINRTKSVLSSALTTLNKTASINFSTANRLKNAYNNAHNSTLFASSSNFTAALIRALLA